MSEQKHNMYTQYEGMFWSVVCFISGKPHNVKEASNREVPEHKSARSGIANRKRVEELAAQTRKV